MTTTPTSSPADPWLPLEPAAIAELFAGTEARWWLSGGVALEHWLGRPIRDHDNVDVSTIPTDLQGPPRRPPRAAARLGCRRGPGRPVRRASPRRRGPAGLAAR